MKNLYDLLGARPDDDAENLRKAYRKAAKASHPDRHGGDQDAAARFRQIAEAYNILRDAEQRAAYDRLLEFERRPFRYKLKRAMSDLKRHVAHDVMAGVVLAIVLAGGYELFVRTSETPVDEATGTSEPEGTVAVQAAQRNGVERDNLDRVAAPPMLIIPGAAPSAANVPGASEMTRDEPVPRQAKQTIDVAGRDDHLGVAIDQASATAGDRGKKQGVYPLDRGEAQSVDVELSLPPRHAFVPNPHSSGGRVFDGRPASEPGGGNTGDVKVPDIKVSARPTTAVKRRTASRPPFKQALLEDGNISACTGSRSCSGGVPPLFGVGP
jgi:curved DNA-binding protein CbpA